MVLPRHYLPLFLDIVRLGSGFFLFRFVFRLFRFRLIFQGSRIAAAPHEGHVIHRVGCRNPVSVQHDDPDQGEADQVEDYGKE